jgi:hypothetical protein
MRGSQITSKSRDQGSECGNVGTWERENVERTDVLTY